MAEWLGNGLQNRVHRFESGHDLQAAVAELAYAHDLKSCGHYARVGSSPTRGTK